MKHFKVYLIYGKKNESFNYYIICLFYENLIEYMKMISNICKKQRL